MADDDPRWRERDRWRNRRGDELHVRLPHAVHLALHRWCSDHRLTAASVVEQALRAFFAAGARREEKGESEK